MHARPARLACSLALATALALPATTFAADPTGAPPGKVVTWQAHVDQMRAMGPNLGAHVTDCVAMHGSMAGLFGPNGSMVHGMAAPAAEAGR